MYFSEIKDLKQLPQDTRSLNIEEIPEIITTNKLLFSAWNTKHVDKWNGMSFKELKRKIGENIERLKHSYNEVLAQRTPDEFNSDLKNANFKDLFEERRYALIRRNTDLRSLPTIRPYFNNPLSPGEGYPFDHAQETHLYIGSPVLLSHYSQDKAWAFILTNDHMAGFIKVQDLMIIPAREAKILMNSHKFGVVIKENLNIYDNNDNFIEHIKLGTILPTTSENGKLKVLVPTHHGLEEIKINPNDIAVNPLAFSKSNIDMIANQLIARPYGFGGYLGNRDSSQLVKDFYAPFGLYLPRNSKEQSEFFPHKTLDVSNLSVKEKLRLLKEKGKPFGALIYKKGRIAIYAGDFEGKPVMLHSVWGVVLSKGKNLSRNVIGKSVISSSKIGKELDNYSKKDSFIYKASKIIFLYK
ncbi:MAG: hypothetical protein BGO27_08395 [Alphaproteobacteria bacterium 33-17]|nr:MAG: hypothetical protein BGO27_08395 [Alphaproteobacteria bacterium 33-17]